MWPMSKRKACPQAYNTPYDAMHEPGKGIKRGVECVKCSKCGKWHMYKLPKNEGLFSLPIHHAIRQEDDVS